MYVLRLHCADQAGIVAAVAGTLAQNGCNIEESAQFNDRLSGQFFMRTVFSSDNAQNFIAAFPEIADRYGMGWGIYPQQQKVKTAILVSKADHCLNDILYRWRTGFLPIEITAVISNHEHNRALTESHGIPYHYLPVDNQQEDRIARLVKETDSELIVLARYMQVLSPGFCQDFMGRIINIHHSFLPGFKGARPYHQAWERGVKIIGATAHYVTADLDDGPIIEQGVVSIDHTLDPEKMQILGKDTESQVLSRAILAYAERRVFLHGNRTVLL